MSEPSRVPVVVWTNIVGIASVHRPTTHSARSLSLPRPDQSSSNTTQSIHHQTSRDAPKTHSLPCLPSGKYYQGNSAANSLIITVTMATAADDSSKGPQQQQSPMTPLGAMPGSDPELWAAQTMTYPTVNEVRRKRPKKETKPPTD